MKKIILLSVFVIGTQILCPDLRAENRQWLNPGIKLGYTFGTGGGFVWGFELSYTFDDDSGFFWGPLIDLDTCHGRVKTHIGIEGSYFGIGVDVGPTFITKAKQTDIGYTVTPFVGVIIYPYYSYTLRPGKSGLHEIGSYVKWPFQVAGEPLSFD